MIALLTDFGQSEYVGEVKGVIKSIAPGAEIIDLSHGIAPYNVRHGAFVLLSSYSFFPMGTVFVCVVDPGVGTSRKPIAIKTKNHFFVGPDNGLLWPAASHDGILEARELSNKKYHLARVSNTFHGRDIFSPAGAHMANGVKFGSLGRKIYPQKMELKAKTVNSDTFLTEIVHIDRFGNLFTTINQKEFKKSKKSIILPAKGRVWRMPLVRSYGFAREGELCALFNSDGFLEIAVSNGNAQKKTGLGIGDSAKVESR